MTTIQRQIFALGGVFENDDIQLEIHREGDGPVPMPLLLTYNSEDPLAVRATFMGGPGKDNIDYYMERNMLFVGRYSSSGGENLRMFPGPFESSTVLAIVEGQKARLALIPTDEISSFLSETQLLVPLGEEKVNIDSFLEQLLKDKE